MDSIGYPDLKEEVKTPTPRKRKARKALPYERKKRSAKKKRKGSAAKRDAEAASSEVDDASDSGPDT